MRRLASVLLALTLVIQASATTPASPRIFPVAGPLEENPYAQAALRAAERILKEKIPAATTGAEAARTLPGFTKPFAFAENTQLLIWAFVTPGSPLHQDPAALQAIIRRMDLAALVYAGGSYFPLYPPKVDNHYNVFFFENFAFNLLALRTLAPGTIPSEVLARWEDLLRKGLAFQVNDPAGHENNGEYGLIPNIDLRYANLLALSAALTDVPRLRAKADALIETSARHLLPQGAFNYLGNENECFSYHESVVRDLARYHFLTGSARAAELIRKSRDYYPLSLEPGGVAEYATAPSWKMFWNGSGTTAGPEIVAHFAGDPVNRGIAAEQRRLNPQLAIVSPSTLLVTMGCYDAKAPTLPQPDNLIQPDANIGGLRGRFGRFAFFADARDRTNAFAPIHATRAPAAAMGAHLGRATYVGALVTDGPTRLQALNAAVLKVGSNVRFDPKKPLWQGSASLSHNSTDQVSLAGGHGALTARYGLGSSSFGPSFQPRAGWVGEEAWLFSRDHLLGFVAVEATEDSAPVEITGRITLGYGRAGPGLQPKTLQTLPENTFAYGDLRVRIVQTNYANLRVQDRSPHFREEAPTATEIVLHDGDAPAPARKGDRRFFVVEIYPAWAKPSASADALTLSPSGLVELKSADGTAALTFNPGPTAVTRAGTSRPLAPGRHELLVR